MCQVPIRRETQKTQVSNIDLISHGFSRTTRPVIDANGIMESAAGLAVWMPGEGTREGYGSGASLRTDLRSISAILRGPDLGFVGPDGL